MMFRFQLHWPSPRERWNSKSITNIPKSVKILHIFFLTLLLLRSFHRLWVLQLHHKVQCWKDIIWQKIFCLRFFHCGIFFTWILRLIKCATGETFLGYPADLNICGFTGSWSYQEFLCVTFINAKIVSWNFFLLLTDLKMDAKVESPSSPSRCKSLYDNGPVEWKSEVYYPFHTAYNNNNKASYRIHIGIWWRNILFRVLGKDTGFSKWCWQGGWEGEWNAYCIHLFKLPIHQSILNLFWSV